MRLWWSVLDAELRQTLRDGNTLLFSVGIPLFLLPVLFWGIGQADAVAEGWRESTTPRVAVEAGLDAPLPDGVHVVAPGEPADAELVRAGAGYRLRFDSADPVSELAKSRLVDTLDPPWELRGVDVAPTREAFVFVLARAMPLVLVVLAAMASLYPAIEAAVADRERNVHETLRVTAAPAWVFAAGKLASVAVITQASMLATLVGTLITFFHLATMSGASFGIPPARVAWILPFSSLTALGAAALSLLAAAAARDFKQAQQTTSFAMVGLMAVAMMAMLPGAELAAPLGWVPFANAVLCMREVLSGNAVGGWGVVALVELVVLVLGASGYAAGMMNRRVSA